jgi:Ca-activated chloride channel family protein
VVVKRAALVAVVALATPPAFAFNWTDLWVSPEQHAQDLLDSGHPAEAAALFADARRRAHAQVKAGQYAQAVQTLAPYHDANSQYNRGNAFARLGNLTAALAAYDEALEHAPKDADVIHNRDLVADASRQQQRNQTSAGGGSKSSSDRSGGRDSPGHSADTSPSRGTPEGNSPTRSSNSPAGHGESARKSAAEAERDRGQAGGSSNGRTRESATSTGPNSPTEVAQKQNRIDADPRSATPKTADGGPENLHGEGSAARLSDLVAQQFGSERNPHSVDWQDMPPALKATAAPKPPSVSEQSIAMDQWLRSIPDDSAELLRRKFLIEHMMKQQPGAK